MPSNVGQTLSTPLTTTEPVRAGSLHVRCTETAVVVWAATLKGAAPAQCVPPSVVVPASAIERPLPTGRPPMTPETVVLWLVSSVPAREKPAGPVIVYEREFSVVPEASCSERPIAPTPRSDSDAGPESVEHPEVSAATEPRTKKTEDPKRIDTSGGRANHVPSQACSVLSCKCPKLVVM